MNKHTNPAIDGIADSSKIWLFYLISVNCYRCPRSNIRILNCVMVATIIINNAIIAISIGINYSVIVIDIIMWASFTNIVVMYMDI